jgi:2-iminobutanoate/2-iminopropanoate deaminase
VAVPYPCENIQSGGCSVVLRQIEGPAATELFFSCQPPAGLESRDQAVAVCSAILDVLQSKGAAYSDVVTETCFLRSLSTDLPAWREARLQVLAGAGESTHKPAVTEVIQPPLNGQHSLELLIHAAVPSRAPVRQETCSAETACHCPECARMHASLVRFGSEMRLYAGSIYGAGASAFAQTSSMFEVAENLLRHAGMEFSDVMRTWIYFPEMERDYAEFNRARRQFFEARGIDPVPASTGIGAGLIPPEHRLCLGIYAVKSDPPIERSVMTTPTLNEAPEYGSDFSRGMRVQEANKVSLLVSGTASLDETGDTVCVGDIEGQARRMLLNVEALLQAQGAGFNDVVSAITYVKHPEDAGKLQAIFQDAGYAGFPNVLVAAEVCRPELLCETELLAVLPAGCA